MKVIGLPFTHFLLSLSKAIVFVSQGADIKPLENRSQSSRISPPPSMYLASIDKSPRSRLGMQRVRFLRDVHLLLWTSN